MRRSRRELLKNSVLALSAGGLLRGSPALETIGVQLYTVRDALTKDAAGTLRMLDEIGYREAELTWASLDRIWADLQKTKLAPVSVHLDSALFQRENAGKLSAAISRCKERGFEYAVHPYVPPNERRDPDLFKNLAETLNRAGAECRKAGLKLCYHNHAFEFQPVGSTTGMEILLGGTDRELAGWEMDIFWVSVGGHDPIELLKKHAGRVPLLHVKNKAAGLPVQYNESVDHAAFKEAGDGSLDIPAILRAASAAGVRHYFVEQDYTPGDPVESLRKSYGYLRKL